MIRCAFHTELALEKEGVVFIVPSLGFLHVDLLSVRRFTSVQMTREEGK